MKNKDSLKASLQARVKEYHDAMNNGDWEKCLAMTSPTKLHKTTKHRYQISYLDFMGACGSVEPQNFLISLVLDQNHLLYERRDYAYVHYERVSPKRDKPIKIKEVWMEWEGTWMCTTTRFPQLS